jgi:hypothetical protein
MKANNNILSALFINRKKKAIILPSLQQFSIINKSFIISKLLKFLIPCKKFTPILQKNFIRLSRVYNGKKRRFFNAPNRVFIFNKEIAYQRIK